MANRHGSSTVAPDQKRALSNWAKWWGRYLRTHAGVKDTNTVFHSFRHGFQDALRQATPDEELRDALVQDEAVASLSAEGTGRRPCWERWGVKALKAAIDKVSYPGLDLSRRPASSQSCLKEKHSGFLLAKQPRVHPCGFVVQSVSFRMEEFQDEEVPNIGEAFAEGKQGVLCC